MVRGEGSFLFDGAGNRYLDFVQGWAVNALGHCPPELVAALGRQSRELISPSPAYHNARAHELAVQLTRLTGFDYAYFCNSGAEANEGAIKLCRKWGRLHRGGADEIVTTHGSFHGRTLAAMSASGKPGFSTLFPPEVPGFRKVPFGDAGAMRAAISERTVALLVEPIQGEAGVIVPNPNYLVELRRLADEHSLLLVADEVQTGMGRTGTLLACEYSRVRPDIVTLGKGLGGGVPIAGMLFTQRANCFSLGDQGGTYHGNPLMAAAALAVLETLTEPGFFEAVRERARILEALLSAVARKHHATLRGRGLLQALVLASPEAVGLRDACFERGLLVNACQEDTLRLMPSLRVTREEIGMCVSTIDEALHAL